MRTSLRLAVCLALGASGCRDYGDYLPPDRARACAEGKASEGCPSAEELGPDATIRFVSPALESGVPGDTVVGRIADLSFELDSATAVAGVELTCAGLQLATWGAQTGNVVLGGTVDLNPCRPAGLAADGGADQVRVIPLEVRVTTALGARIVSGGWLLPVDFSAVDPGTGSFPVLSLSPMRLPAGVPLEFTIRSDLGLVEPPALTLEGLVAFPAARAVGTDGKVWVVDLPGGIDPWFFVPDPSSLATRSSPRTVPFRLAGRSAEGMASQLAGTLRIEREQRRFDGLQLAPQQWDLGRRDPSAPVALDAGTLFAVEVPATPPGGPPQRLPLLLPAAPDADPVMTTPTYVDPVQGELPLSVVAFNAGGQALLRTPDGSGTPLVLQAGAERTEVLPLNAGALPTSSVPVRLRDGRLCAEELLSDPCGLEVFVRRRFACVDPAGTIEARETSEAKTATNPGGTAASALGLDTQWVTYGYRAADCSGTLGALPDPQQLFFVVGQEIRPQGGFGLAPPQYAAGEPGTFLFEATPESIVVGNVSDATQTIEARHVYVDQEIGSLPFFAAPGSLPVYAETPGRELLFSNPEGILVGLRQGGLQFWQAGLDSPVAELTLVDAFLVAPAGLHQGFHLAGLPTVRHPNLNVTVALRDALENRIVVLELTAAHRIEWAWRSEPGLADGSAQFSVHGVPGGRFVDLVRWHAFQGARSTVIRLAR